MRHAPPFVFLADILSFAGDFASFGAMSRLGAFVITGAGSGIGLAIAGKIIEQGHKAFAIGRTAHKLEEANRLYPRLKTCTADLSSATDTERAGQELTRWLAQENLPLLGLVNNAGIFERVSFAGSGDDLWLRSFDNNLLSAVRLSRHLLPWLKKAAPSSILNISSTLGLRPIANTSAYSAMKSAMINWTQSLALELASEQIRVNCICPGIVDTPMHAFPTDPADPLRQRADRSQPLGHIGQAVDIAEAAWFLLSEKSRWTTGSVLNVDGGINL